MAARHVVLVGPPASGKSTLARALAARLGVACVDTDAAVERAAGCTVAELFARDGEPAFRARERAAFEAALAEETPTVIATGGGTLVDRALRHATLRRATVLALAAPVDVLAARATNTPGARPLLAGDARARLAGLVEARAEAYAEAHALLRASDTPEAVLADALAVVDDVARHPTLVVPLGERTYRVCVAPLAGLGTRVAALAPSATVLVTDRRVAVLPAGIAAEKRLTPAARVVFRTLGERGKTLRSVSAIWDAALAAEVDRDAVVVGVGGGVVTDLAGFAAATLLRGLRCVGAPTTLLAMVDASVGGKTGFDHAMGKNLLGAFHQPSLVVCDPAALATLPARDVRAGLAEVVKIALARDAGLLAQIEAAASALDAGDLAAVAALIPAAIQAKIDVVVRDEREAGERAVLNFGHTVGHAIESAAGYAIPHGECVALGMRAALHLGVQAGVTPATFAQDALRLLDALGMPRKAAERVDRKAATAALQSDKKRRAGALRFVLCTGPGAATLTEVAPRDAVAAMHTVL